MRLIVYLLLVEDFHCIIRLFLFVLGEHDPSEGTRSQRLDPVEVLQLRRVLKRDFKLEKSCSCLSFISFIRENCESQEKKSNYYVTKFREEPDSFSPRKT